ncbi:MAG: metal-dependent transcriptional regulator [Oscillospiraceae bacterium]
MNLYESGENYLESIWLLSQEASPVRSVDVAERLGVTKASVSRAMSILRNEGYIDMPKNGAITLTQKGMLKGANVCERHAVIAQFLEKMLGVSQRIADCDACRIEHIISDETFEAIRAQCGGGA